MSAIPEPTTLLRPILAFEDNLRPARLMLDMYRLLDCDDEIETDGEFVDRLREVVKAAATEDLMVVQNEIFVGLVRERAGLTKSALKRATLTHLLRQAIVASCTALEAYLPGLLRVRFPELIRLKGRDFLPQDDSVREYCQDLVFKADEVVRLIADEDAPVYISNKLLGLATFRYLAGRTGVHVVGALLGLDKPWDMIAAHLSRDKKELMSTIDATVKRRNDIVHRADRAQASPGGEQQPITFAQAKQGVDIVGVVCLALDELVAIGVKELRRQQEAR